MSSWKDYERLKGPSYFGAIGSLLRIYTAFMTELYDEILPQPFPLEFYCMVGNFVHNDVLVLQESYVSMKFPFSWHGDM